MAYPIPDSPNPVGLDIPACKRLISRTFSPQEVTSLIEAVFVSKDEVKMVRDLRGDDAQTLIDVIHGVRSILFFPRAHSDYLSSSTPSLPNPNLSPIRLWISRISSRGFGGPASVSYAGSTVVGFYFRDHYKSRFAIIGSIPRCIAAGSLTCGRVNTKVAMLPSRC